MLDQVSLIPTKEIVLLIVMITLEDWRKRWNFIKGLWFLNQSWRIHFQSLSLCVFLCILPYLSLSKNITTYEKNMRKGFYSLSEKWQLAQRGHVFLISWLSVTARYPLVDWLAVASIHALVSLWRALDFLELLAPGSPSAHHGEWARSFLAAARLWLVNLWTLWLSSLWPRPWLAAAS